MEEPLTDNEGSLLGVVVRRQPVTTYQLLKIYEDSPVSSFNSSKGSVYKMVKRLTGRGLLNATPIEGDARNSEMLSCTEKGLGMIRAWVKDVRPVHTLIADPLRTRVLSLNLLDRDEQIEWAVDAKNLLLDKMKEVREYNRGADVPYQEIVYLSSIGSIEEKISWLDRLLTIVVKDKGE